MRNVYVALWLSLRDLPGCRLRVGASAYQRPLRGPMGELGLWVEHPDWRARISLVLDSKKLGRVLINCIKI